MCSRSLHLTIGRTTASTHETLEFIAPDLWPPNSPDLNPVNCRVEKKRTGQEKVTKRLYFTYLWRRPTEVMYMKICLVGDVLDIIICAKFQNEIFMGYDFTGDRIFHFPIDF